MALQLQQQPLYRLVAAEQDIIFVIKESTSIVANESKVKFVAYVNVMSDSAAPVQIGVFKTTPNAAEVGIFDFSTILKNYVTPDFTGTDAGGVISTFKGAAYSNTNYHSLHTVDKSALGVNSVKWFQIDFKIEYEGANPAYPDYVAEDTSMSRATQEYVIYNGVVDETDVLKTIGSNFGYDLDTAGFATYGTVTGGALSDAPLTQYVRITDYGTLPFFSNCIPPIEGINSPTIDNAEVEMFNSSGASLGTFDVAVTSSATTTLAMNKIVFIGCFPANFSGAGYSDWNTHKDDVAYYTVKTENATIGVIGQTYRFDIICESGRGYEGIRLTWLNKHGTWDYYTFNKKSVRSLSTNRKTYTQLSGTWNEATFKLHGSSGGRKNYKVDTKEKIKMNTDYISQDESVWLEQLINSPEVYILNGYQSDVGGTLRRYVQPVTLTTSSHTRKTIANDKLIQYTFEVERTNNQRTQSV